MQPMLMQRLRAVLMPLRRELAVEEERAATRDSPSAAICALLLLAAVASVVSLLHLEPSAASPHGWGALAAATARAIWGTNATLHLSYPARALPRGSRLAHTRRNRTRRANLHGRMLEDTVEREGATDGHVERSTVALNHSDALVWKSAAAWDR
ncbi:hypothetical protein AB1Y20_008499 [Prymnesium parvum]|uniref:Mannosyltransferase n=1 Tax=Prymnesium parvum TaxID=97485 RepID=A0AB34IQG9_PRYPA